LWTKETTMANFISFTQAPVYLGTVETQVPQTGIAGLSNLIAANSCDLSFDSSLDASKYLGKQPVSNDFFVTGPKTSKVSISYIPLVGSNLLEGIQEAALLPFSLTGQFQSGHCIRVGDFLFKQCYLDSLGVQITPNSPVRLNAQFTSYDSSQVENDVYSGFSDSAGFVVSTNTGASYSAVHALAMNVSGSSYLPESKTDITINYQMSRTPVYEIGSSRPKTVFLNAVSRQTSISAENIGEVITFSGKSAVLNLKFAEFGRLMEESFDPATDYRFRIDVTGKINSQNLSMSPGRVLEGKLSIVENIF